MLNEISTKEWFLKKEYLSQGGFAIKGANPAGLGKRVFLSADLVSRRGIAIYCG